MGKRILPEDTDASSSDASASSRRSGRRVQLSDKAKALMVDTELRGSKAAPKPASEVRKASMQQFLISQQGDDVGVERVVGSSSSSAIATAAQTGGQIEASALETRQSAEICNGKKDNWSKEQVEAMLTIAEEEASTGDDARSRLRSAELFGPQLTERLRELDLLRGFTEKQVKDKWSNMSHQYRTWLDAGKPKIKLTARTEMKRKIVSVFDKLFKHAPTISLPTVRDIGLGKQKKRSSMHDDELETDTTAPGSQQDTSDRGDAGVDSTGDEMTESQQKTTAKGKGKVVRTPRKSPGRNRLFMEEQAEKNRQHVEKAREESKRSNEALIAASVGTRDALVGAIGELAKILVAASQTARRAGHTSTLTATLSYTNHTPQRNIASDDADHIRQTTEVDADDYYSGHPRGRGPPHRRPVDERHRGHRGREDESDRRTSAGRAEFYSNRRS
jgi:hypothetical protein